MTEKDKTYENVILDMSPRRIEAIINNVNKYSNWMHDYCYPKKENSFYMTIKSTDHEGSFPSEMLSLKCLQGNIEKVPEAKVLWMISLEYKSTSSDIYDYTNIVRLYPSTAYKMRFGGQSREVRFKLANILLEGVSWDYVKISSEHLQRLYDDLLYLERSFLIANDLTKDISTWTSSGMGMIPFCHCRTLSILSNQTISEFSRNGLTLEQLKQRLKCKRCGKRPYKLLPPEGELNQKFLNYMENQPALTNMEVPNDSFRPTPLRGTA